MDVYIIDESMLDQNLVFINNGDSLSKELVNFHPQSCQLIMIKSILH